MNFKRTALLAVLLLFSGCDTGKLNDALDNFDVVIGLDPINTSASGQFVDARTGELIEQPVTVTFEGRNGGDVIDMYSKPLEQLEVDGGLISFGLRNNVAPSQSSPASVTVVTESEGYVGTGRDVTITSEGQTSFTVYMVDRDNPPEGSSFRSESAGEANDGAVTEDITASSGTEGQSNSSATINVEQGTVVRDADGNPLNGRLRAMIGYFNNQSEQALKSFPGGFTTADGEMLITAGFSSVDIEDSEGNQAKTFSKPVDLNMEIPGDMQNPATGEPYRAGDELSVYSYDTESAEWVTEGSATLKGPNENGNFYTDIKTDHLSHFGVQYPPGLAGQTCHASSIININRNGNNGVLKVTIKTNGILKELYSYPPNDKLSYSISDNLHGQVSITVESGTVTDTGPLCGANFTLNLPPPPPEMVDSVNVEARLRCPNTDEYVRITDIPTATVKYRKSGAEAGTSWKTASNLAWNYNEEHQRLEGGSFDVFNVIEGSDYDFKIYYDGETYSREGIILNAPATTYTEEVSNDVCN